MPENHLVYSDTLQIPPCYLALKTPGLMRIHEIFPDLGSEFCALYLARPKSSVHLASWTSEVSKLLAARFVPDGSLSFSPPAR